MEHIQQCHCKCFLNMNKRKEFTAFIWRRIERFLFDINSSFFSNKWHNSIEMQWHAYLFRLHIQDRSIKKRIMHTCEYIGNCVVVEYHTLVCIIWNNTENETFLCLPQPLRETTHIFSLTEKFFCTFFLLPKRNFSFSPMFWMWRRLN